MRCLKEETFYTKMHFNIKEAKINFLVGFENVTSVHCMGQLALSCEAPIEPRIIR